MAYDPLSPTGDPFGPPAIPTIVFCLHCQQEYDSYLIEWRIVTGHDGKPHGFWCCPMPGCDGTGFGFDIFPADPEWRNDNGEKMWCDDDDETNEDDESWDEDEQSDEAYLTDEPPINGEAGQRKEYPEEDQIPF